MSELTGIPLSEIINSIDEPLTKYYWGKFEIVRGHKRDVWLDEPMTRVEMIEFDDTYRHRCREVENE